MPPLLAVGMEGFWGLLLCAAALPLAERAPAVAGGQPFDSLPQVPADPNFTPAPCALRSAPCALRSAPCTLRPAPCALHPAPCALRPDPWGAPPSPAPQAVAQMRALPHLAICVLLSTVSIAFFNFFGVSVTKHMSATTRMLLDSLRTMVM